MNAHDEAAHADTSVPTLAGIVADAAAIEPDAIALVGLDVELTWGDVDRQTAALARTMLDAGVAPGDRIAIARRKGHESFLAVHAVLRAGATMVPIDPLAPPAVAHVVLADADVRAVIGDARTIAALDPWSAIDGRLAAVVATGQIDDARMSSWDAAVAGEVGGELPSVDVHDVAYIIYTSGSTGRPKGIVHTHASALAYAERAVVEYGLEPHDRVAGMNPLHFDMSTLELYAAPLARSTVVVMSEPHLQFPAGLTQRSAEQAVSIWYGVPFLLKGVVERGGLERLPLPALRKILYGGEPYPGASLRELMDALPHIDVVNVYGPAEVNACTHHHLRRASDVGDDVPIGRPWEGAEVRIVDDAGGDATPGTPGELWVSTPTVMRGYWGLDELTAERFEHRPASPPWYATGDIVVEDDDGVLWFRGRRDHQVKVRGVRLELEAIENVLTDAPDVVHAVAGPVGPAGDASSIDAVVVLRSGAELDTAALRKWCGERLPSLAVPRNISERLDLPTTPSGKIDRTAVRRMLRDGNADGDEE